VPAKWYRLPNVRYLHPLYLQQDLRNGQEGLRGVVRGIRVRLLELPSASCPQPIRAPILPSHGRKANCPHHPGLFRDRQLLSAFRPLSAAERITPSLLPSEAGVRISPTILPFDSCDAD